MRNFRKIISPTLTAALLTLQLAPGFLVPKKAQAIIASGAPAIDVIGQYKTGNAGGSLEDDYTRGGANSGPNTFGFSSPKHSAIDTVGHRLFVSDQNNNRVLVFNLNSSNQVIDYMADYVLGQANMYSSADAVTSTGMTSPGGLAWDSANSRLFVTEEELNRVLVFDLSGGITSGMAASNVLGQANFTSSSSGTTSSTLSWPVDLTWDSANSRLYVTDNGNSRVLVFDLSGGITDGMAASNVLGQANFTSDGVATTGSGFYFPNDTDLDSVNDRLFVADYFNHRVLVFDVATLADGEPAVNVLGQTLFTTRSSGTTSTAMNAPQGVAWDSVNSRLFVVDVWNNRVLVFDLSGGITDGMAASNVLGQANFTSSSGTASAAGLSYPYRVTYDSGNSVAYVSDNGNNRLVVYDVATIADGEAASGVMGQPDSASSTFPPVPTGTSFTKNGANGGPFMFATFNSPQATVFDPANQRLFVSDGGNNRVLVFDTDQYGKPTDFFPDNVLGQASFTTSVATTASTGMYGSNGLAWDSANSRLFVVDVYNHRVLVFDLSGGITDGMAASNVLGQTSFTASSSGTTNSKLNYPADVEWDAGNSRLFVADANNYRVLVFDLSSGITDGMAASNVLGQANFTSRVSATTQSGMKYVIGVEWDSANSRLFVGDNWSRRVTVFDLSSGITNGMNASYVLGQATFTSATSSTTSTGMAGASDTDWDSENDRLYVADYGNNRVLVFDTATLANGEAAINVLGQPNFTTSSADASAGKMRNPTSVNYISAADRLLVVDSLNNRVLTFDVATAAGTLTATRDNKVTLSRLAAGASADFSLSFDLAHVVSSTLTVTFPAGFTVTAAATTASSSSCLSNFGYTSNTLTADKSLCGGPITLGGATVTLPSTPGAYTITWVNDDPGSATVIIVSNDQISITATVAPTVSFLAVAQPAASTCANTSDLTGSDYTLALGTLNVATITESESLNADSDTVERICTQGSTNATSGMAVTVKNANGSSGLVSSSVPADTIPSSASGQLAAGTPGYGVCVRGSSLASDSGLTPTGADPTATGDFSTYECESASGYIVALTGAAQGLWSASGPTQDATAAIWVRVAISAVQPAHNDYADSLTFVATATY